MVLFLPTLAVIVLLGWSIGLPLADSVLSNDLARFPQSVIVMTTYVGMFGLSAWTWISMALMGYAAGVWLLRKHARRANMATNRKLVALLLVHLPLAILVLSLFHSKYRGP